MGELVLCAVSPHPPLLIPDVGGGNIRAVKRTQEAMRELGRRVREATPDAIVIISPHAPVFRDAVAIMGSQELSGDFRGFGAPHVSLSFPCDLELASAIAGEAKAAGIPAVMLEEKAIRRYGTTPLLDHGILVPMYYIMGAGTRVPLVAMGMAFLPPEDLYIFGKALREAVKRSSKRVALIASGDLSHRLTPDAPAGYYPDGKVFDEEIVRLLGQGDILGIMGLDPALVERAGECGYKSIIMMFGALDGLAISPEVLSYEGPFGVGYAVAVFTPTGESKEREILERLVGAREREIRERRAKESPPVRLARTAVEEYVRNRRVIEPPSDFPSEFQGRAGAFCSIKKKGQLRGCIGTIQPVTPDIAQEIIRNAIAAATEDPRFDPVEPRELDDLAYSVDILKPPERISGIDELDPKRYGVIVKKGGRSGLLLPDLEGIDDPRQQVEIAKRKAGIGPHESSVELSRFEVTRYL